MVQLIASFGGSVRENGRIGQHELLRAKARADLHYYVGHWPEIDCIAVRESAAVGCLPLTSTVAAFGDVRKDYCLKVPGDPRDAATQRAAAEMAIRLLQQAPQLPRGDRCMTQQLAEETWDRIGERWLQELNNSSTSSCTDGGNHGA